MKKVLLLEDEEVLGKLYKLALEEGGFEVEWTKGFKETEELLQKCNFDIVVLDHGIRGDERSGIEFIPFVKNCLPKSKTVILSNYSKVVLKDKAISNGAEDYLLKIDTPPKLLASYLKKF